MDGIFVEGFPGNGICTLEGTVHFEIKDSGANKNGGAGAVFNGKDIKVSHFTAIGNIGTGVIINAISSIFNKLKINYNGTGIEANGSDITITESESINNISADLSVSATATNVNVSTSTITKIEDNSNGQLALDSATKASLCPANYNPSEDGLMCILICSRTDQFDHNGICIDECPAGTLVDRYRICRKIGSADPVYDTAVDVGVDGDDAGSGGCGCTMAESKTPIADAAILLILALVPLTFAIRKRVAITMGNFSKIKRVSIITLTIFIFNLAANLGSVKWVQGVAHATDKTVYAGAKYAEAELKKNLPINIVKILKETEGLHDYSYEFITSGDVFTDHIYADESYDDGYGDGGGDFGDGEDDGDYDSGEGDFGDIDNGTTVDDDDGNPIEWQESQNDLDAEAEAVDLDDLDAEAEAVDLDDVDWASYPEPDMSLDEIIAEYESFDNSAITVEAEVEDYNEDDEFIAALNKGSDDSAINAEAEAYLPTDMDDWYEAAREEQRAKDERDEAYKSMTACQSSDDGCSDPEYGEYMQVAKKYEDAQKETDGLIAELQSNGNWDEDAVKELDTNMAWDMAKDEVNTIEAEITMLNLEIEEIEEKQKKYKEGTQDWNKLEEEKSKTKDELDDMEGELDESKQNAKDEFVEMMCEKTKKAEEEAETKLKAAKEKYKQNPKDQAAKADYVKANKKYSKAHKEKRKWEYYKDYGGTQLLPEKDWTLDYESWITKDIYNSPDATDGKVLPNELTLSHDSGGCEAIGCEDGVCTSTCAALELSYKSPTLGLSLQEELKFLSTSYYDDPYMHIDDNGELWFIRGINTATLIKDQDYEGPWDKGKKQDFYVYREDPMVFNTHYPYMWKIPEYKGMYMGMINFQGRPTHMEDDHWVYKHDLRDVIEKNYPDFYNKYKDLIITKPDYEPNTSLGAKHNCAWVNFSDIKDLVKKKTGEVCAFMYFWDCRPVYNTGSYSSEDEALKAKNLCRDYYEKIVLKANHLFLFYSYQEYENDDVNTLAKAPIVFNKKLSRPVIFKKVRSFNDVERKDTYEAGSSFDKSDYYLSQQQYNKAYASVAAPDIPDDSNEYPSKSQKAFAFDEEWYKYSGKDLDPSFDPVFKFDGGPAKFHFSGGSKEVAVVKNWVKEAPPEGYACKKFRGTKLLEDGSVDLKSDLAGTDKEGLFCKRDVIERDQPNAMVEGYEKAAVYARGNVGISGFSFNRSPDENKIEPNAVDAGENTYNKFPTIFMDTAKTTSAYGYVDDYKHLPIDILNSTIHDPVPIFNAAEAYLSPTEKFHDKGYSLWRVQMRAEPLAHTGDHVQSINGQFLSDKNAYQFNVKLGSDAVTRIDFYGLGQDNMLSDYIASKVLTEAETKGQQDGGVEFQVELPLPEGKDKSAFGIAAVINDNKDRSYLFNFISADGEHFGNGSGGCPDSLERKGIGSKFYGSDISEKDTTWLYLDTDMDGISDHEEYGEEFCDWRSKCWKNDGVCQPLTDPTQMQDKDGDKISDQLDNCPDQANPDQTDTDADGLGDLCDPDIDGDGLLNTDETSKYASDPLKKDSDLDGLTDSQEVGLGTDLNKADTDEDGLLDGEEVNVIKTNPTLADTDGDRLPDGDEIKTHNTDPLNPKTFYGVMDPCIVSNPELKTKNVYFENDADGDPFDCTLYKIWNNVKPTIIVAENQNGFMAKAKVTAKKTEETNGNIVALGPVNGYDDNGADISTEAALEDEAAGGGCTLAPDSKNKNILPFILMLAMLTGLAIRRKNLNSFKTPRQ